MAFVERRPAEMAGNPFSMIGDEWMLITAGDETRCNTMTASWGGLGVLWNKPVSFIFVRPQRYTRSFIEAQEKYTLSFFDPEWKKQLGYLGRVSGRDENKIENAGLTVAFSDGAPCFEQARLVLVCRKLYRQDLEQACFVDSKTDRDSYPEQDYHRLYVGEVLRVLEREK